MLLLGHYHPIPTVLTLDDIRHLDAAESWLERGHYLNCFHELERIDFNNREDQRVLALRWELYSADKQNLAAADLALGVQRRFPHEPAGYVWRAISLTRLGCAQEAYDSLAAVAGKFDGLGVVPYTLAVLAAQLQRTDLVSDWLIKVHATPEGREMRSLSLEEKERNSFWRKIGNV